MKRPFYFQSVWYENLILLHFFLQMFNDIYVKNSWETLRCKFQLKQITKCRWKCCSQWKLHSEKSGFKISKPQLQPYAKYYSGIGKSRPEKFGSQLDGKNKTWFFTFLNMYVTWIRRDKNSDLTAYTSKWGSSAVRARK